MVAKPSTAPPSLNLSFSRSRSDVKNLELVHLKSFDELVENLEQDTKSWPLVQDGKKPKGLGLLIPVAEWHELHRLNKNTKTMARVFMADFDRLTDDQLSEVIEALDGVSAYLHTTWSHKTPQKDELNCVRVIIELDKEYAPGNFLGLYDAMNERFGGLLDPECRKRSQGYFLPAINAPYEEHYVSHRFEGAPMKAPEDIEAPSAQESPKAVGEQVPKALLVRSLESWARYNGSDPERAKRAVIGRDAKRMVQDKKPVDIQPGNGERHGWMTSLAGFLARQFPFDSALGVCDHFRTIGWDFFADGDQKDHGVDRLITMVEDFQTKEQQRLEELEAQRLEEQKKTIHRVTRGQRDRPLDEEEIGRLEELYGAEWRKYIALQYRRAFFLMEPDGTYSTDVATRDDLMVRARDHMEIFGDEATLWFEDKNGEMRKHNYDSLRQEYATAIYHVKYDLTAHRTNFDPKEGALKIACAPPTVTSEYDETIQTWLRAAGGDLLLDMVAAMPRLDEQLPALVLTGPPGTGKNVIAEGIAWVYGSGPNASKDTHGRFNAQLLQQPITFHDEKAGEEYRRSGTTLIREFTTAKERWIEEKFMPKVKLYGYPRLIFAANNHHILNTEEALTAGDREGMASRIVHIEMPGELVKWNRENRALIDKEWCKGPRRFSRHVRWLAENWEIKNRGDRFLVQGARTKLHDGLAGGAGVAGEVVQWLLSYIANPATVECTTDAPLEMNAEKSYLRVTAKAILHHWDKHLQTMRPQRTSEVQKALNSLSHPKRQKIAVKGKNKTRVEAYEIDLNMLRANLDNHHLLEEDFDKALGLVDDVPPGPSTPEDGDFSTPPKLRVV